MIVYYSGIGCKKSFEHTKEEFIIIMNKHFTWKDWNNDISWPAQLEFKDWKLPDDFIFFTFDDWIEYSGAEIKDTHSPHDTLSN